MEEERTVQGGVIINPASAWAKELSKWEQFPTSFTGIHGVGNPYRYREYPQMLYKAYRRPGGSVECMEAEPHPSLFKDSKEHDRACAAAVHFTEQCQRIVKDDVERSRAFEEGWRESPQAAIDFIHAKERAVSTAAAERNYSDRNMSDLAKAEAAAAEADADGHLAEIPRRRGRPRKIQPPAA